MVKFFLIFMTAFAFSGHALALNCHGTEPFWVAKVSDSKVELDTIGEKYSLNITKVSAAAGTTQEFLKVFSDDRGPIAVMTANKCNNGMSDEIFPKEIVIFTGSTTLYGCCN